jgi:hypothetical protein
MYDIRRVVLAPVLALILTGCSESPSDPGLLTVQAVAGTYGASGEFGAFTFTTTSTGVVTDWLEQGAGISLRLNANGTTEGELFVPGADEDGTDVEEDLSGTWQLAGNVVSLDHDADTFLRDVPFTVVANRLEVDHTFSETRVRLTLQRQ